MPSHINKHNLSRNIPKLVARKVRQRCGFGCVICGCSIIQYDHFNPEFVNAVKHDPDGITLLCANCHFKKSKKQISLSKIIESNANPFCIKNKISKDSFVFDANSISVKIASNLFLNCNVVLNISGMDIIRIDPPEDYDQPFLLSGLFFDHYGRQILSIVKNEYKLKIENLFDFESIGSNFVIKAKNGEIVFSASLEDGNVFNIKKINMYCFGVHVLCNEDLLLVNGGSFGIRSTTFSGVENAISL